MSDDLVKRLRYGIVEHRKRWSGDTHADLGGSVDYDATTDMLYEAATRIEELEAKLAKTVEALQFYGTLIGEKHECPWHMNSEDFGAKARTTLAELTGGKDE